MKSKPGAQINHSILDGFTILQAIVTSGKPVGGSDVARQLNMESTRVNRLLKTLASIGMVSQTTDRKYTSGPGIHVLATQSLYASGLLSSAIPALEKLADLELTVAMGVLWFDSVSFLYHAKPGMTSAQGIGRIGLRPATDSGIGMVLLAHSEEASVREVFAHKDRIPNYPEGIEQLLIELNNIKQLGYARTELKTPETELEKIQCTIAVPIGNPINSAIAVSGYIPTEQTEAIVQHLYKAKYSIEQMLLTMKSDAE